MLTVPQMVLAVVSGAAVGFSLGLIGGGGSLLAIPLLVYVVGLRNLHLAIGSAALAVSVNAFFNLIPHWRTRQVDWLAAAGFALPGAMGAYWGSKAGKALDGQALLCLFGLFLIGVACTFRRSLGHAPAQPRNRAWWRMSPTGLAVGLIAGFFGIGGGFLIVPGLVMATGMPMATAVGTSLVAVGSFGLTTAVNYALAGEVDWSVVAAFLLGGTFGGIVGAYCTRRLSTRPQVFRHLMSGLMLTAAVYTLAVNLPPLLQPQWFALSQWAAHFSRW